MRACVCANEWSVYVMYVRMCICESGGVVCMHVCGREYGGKAMADIVFPH